MEKVLTKGDVIVNELKIGDIIYEFELGCGIESEVISTPEINKDGNWVFKTKNTKSGKIIDYVVNPKYPHYAPNLYTYKAYRVNCWI